MRRIIWCHLLIYYPTKKDAKTLLQNLYSFTHLKEPKKKRKKSIQNLLQMSKSEQLIPVLTVPKDTINLDCVPLKIKETLSHNERTQKLGKGKPLKLKQ